jgi:putative acetyltransferase
MTESREDAESFLRTLRDSIRGVASADYRPEVIEGWAPDLSEQAVQRVLDNPEREIRVLAELDGEVVGLGSIVPKDNQLRACYVSPAGIRKGIGTAIVNRLEELAREHAVRHLELHATVTAQPFYEHLGYTSKQRITHTTSGGIKMDAVYMIKSLSHSVCNRAP